MELPWRAIRFNLVIETDTLQENSKMNKTWLTGITMAGIAGSGGLAYAGVNVISSASAESAPAAESTAPAAIRSITYQIGVAGLVTIQSDGTTLTALDPHPGAGWTFVGATDAAAHVDVQFTDGQQLVTFSADQVGAEIVRSATVSFVVRQNSAITPPQGPALPKKPRR